MVNFLSFIFLPSRSLTCMNKNRLLKYLEGNWDYAFRVGNYIVPKFMNTVNGNEINLLVNRYKNLRQGSSWSPYFREMLKDCYPDLAPLREFPFLIEHRKYWEKLCEEYELDEDCRDRNYFIVDFIFPEQNFIVEIDSQIHKTNYDLARDNYILFLYQVPTLRLFEFGKEEDTTRQLIYDFDFELNEMKRSGCKFNIDYSGCILRRFYDKNEDIIPALNLIESAILGGRIRNNTFTIRKSDRLVKNREELSRIQDIIMGTYGVFVGFAG